MGLVKQGKLFCIILIHINVVFMCESLDIDTCDVMENKASLLHRHSWTMYQYKDLNKQKINTFFKHVFEDIFNTGKYLFTTDSLKVLTWTMPLYISARFADNKIHSVFYDDATHTNRNQIPGSWNNIILKDQYTAIPYVLYGSLGFMRSNDEKRREAQIFMTGLGWVFTLKYIVKEILPFDANLRPFNENFPKQYVYGGAPSGHTAMAVFMTTYLSCVEGVKGGLPMGIFSFLVAGLSITTNTHFLSQVIAGAGIGVFVGLASARVLSQWQNDRFELSLVSENKGRVGMRCAWNF